MRTSENPKTYKISVRINDTTMQKLEKIASQSGKTLSEIIRKLLETL